MPNDDLRPPGTPRRIHRPSIQWSGRPGDLTEDAMHQAEDACGLPPDPSVRQAARLLAAALVREWRERLPVVVRWAVGRLVDELISALEERIGGRGGVLGG